MIALIVGYQKCFCYTVLVARDCIKIGLSWQTNPCRASAWSEECISKHRCGGSIPAATLTANYAVRAGDNMYHTLETTQVVFDNEVANWKGLLSPARHGCGT